VVSHDTDRLDPGRPALFDEASAVIAAAFGVVSVLIVLAGAALLLFNILTPPVVRPLSEEALWWTMRGVLGLAISLTALGLFQFRRTFAVRHLAPRSFTGLRARLALLRQPAGLRPKG